MSIKKIFENKIFSNASWIIGCKFVKAILTFVVTIITARYLGPSDYGLINYAAGIVAFFTPIMKLGFDGILVHEFVKNPDEDGKIIGTSFVLNIASALLCVIGVFTFSSIINASETETILVCTIYSLLLLFQAIELIQYWFQTKLLSKHSSIAMLVAYGIVTLFQISLLLTKQSVYLFALSHSIDFLVIAIILIIKYKKLTHNRLSFSSAVAKRLLKNGKYYILSGLMTTIFNQTDRIMLKMMIGNSAVGFYSAATTCATMLSFVFVAIIDSSRSSIFSSKNNNENEFDDKVITLYSIIIYFSLFVSLMFTLFAPLIIKVMYGIEYIESIDILRVICWFIIFSYIGTIRDIWILSEGKQKYIWIINTFGAVLNIILNIAFIKLYGALGAAIATVLTQFFTNVIIGFILKPIRKNNYLMIKSLNPVFFFRKIKEFVK